MPGDNHQTLRFELSAHEVVELLVGNNIYADPPAVVVRELLQNAVDACRLRLALDPGYRPQITFAYIPDGPPAGGATAPGVSAAPPCPGGGPPPGSARLRVTDNGVGMTADVVRTFFLRVGRSYYASDEFRSRYPGVQFTPIARFGIGALSCFLIAQQLTVETRHHGGGPPVRLEIDGPHSLIRASTPAADRPPGTDLELVLKPGVRYGDLAATVRRWARHLELPITVQTPDGAAVVPADDGSGYRRRLLDPEHILLRDPARRHLLQTRRLDCAGADGLHGFIEYLYVCAPGALRRPDSAGYRGLVTVYGDRAPRSVSLDGIYVGARLPGFLGADQGPGGGTVAYDVNLDSRRTGVQLKLDRRSFVADAPYQALVERLDTLIMADLIALVRGQRLGPVQHAESLAALVDVQQLIRHSRETGATGAWSLLAAEAVFPLRAGGSRRYLDWAAFAAHDRVGRVAVGEQRVRWPETAAHLEDDFWWDRHHHLCQWLDHQHLPYFTSLDANDLVEAFLRRHYAPAAVAVHRAAGVNVTVFARGAPVAPTLGGLPCLPFDGPEGAPEPDLILAHAAGWTLNARHPVVAAALALVPGSPARLAAEKPWLDLRQSLGQLPGPEGAGEAAAALGAAVRAEIIPPHDLAPYWEAAWQRFLGA